MVSSFCDTTEEPEALGPHGLYEVEQYHRRETSWVRPRTPSSVRTCPPPQSVRCMEHYGTSYNAYDPSQTFTLQRQWIFFINSSGEIFVGLGECSKDHTGSADPTPLLPLGFDVSGRTPPSQGHPTVSHLRRVPPSEPPLRLRCPSRFAPAMRNGGGRRKGQLHRPCWGG